MGAQKLALLGGRRVAGPAAGVRPIRIDHAFALYRVHDDGTLAAIAATALLWQCLAILGPSP